MKTTTSMKLFVKQFAALIKGDTAEQQALKTFRKAVSAITAHIAKLKGDTISFEDAVETAQENADKALLNNGQDIDNRDSYVRMLVQRNNELKQAQENLNSHLELLAFLEENLKKLETEVEQEN